ncbi:MAG: aminoglycoside phosphotransferase [Alphaproteobacteria bacterium]|nr:MAG: aminoglycoside phosphotransferase [Alphaproteobacteria bacterium]
MSRAEERAQFLEAAGWPNARIAPLAGDASARRYARIAGREGRTAMLMDAAPEHGMDLAPFIAITLWLREQGFSAPEILHADPARGLLLIEDFGRGLYADLCTAQPGMETELYEAAVDLLAALQTMEPPARLAPYDADILLEEAGRLILWYLPAASGTEPGADMAAEYRALLLAALGPVAEATGCVVLRDYHAQNLFWLPERSGLARVGLIDYQDALRGHPAYDLVSLLEDARRDTGAGLHKAMMARHLAATGLEPEAFRQALAALGAQRNLKIVGLFCRLWLRDGKPHYLDLIPRVWWHLQRDLAAPGMADLARWVARHVPPPEPSVLDRIRGQRA